MRIEARTSLARGSAARTLAVGAAVSMLLAVVPAAPAVAAGCSDTSIAYGGGDGSSGDPYLIATVAHLQALRDRVNEDVEGSEQEDCYFRQTADLDLDGLEWVAIGTDTSDGDRTKFLGHYDGDFHLIENLTITTQVDSIRYYGLFGYTRHGSVQNLRLTGVDIDLAFAGKTSERYVGGLVARMNSSSSGGSPDTVLATASVQGRVEVDYSGGGAAYVGGVVGRSAVNAKVDDRVAFVGDVGGTFETTDAGEDGNYGGLVGRTSFNSTLSLGYAAANVTVTAGAGNVGDIFAGVLAGTSSTNPSILAELYAVGSASVAGTAPAGKGYYAGALGYIGHEDDVFTEIYYLDTIRGDGAFAGGAKAGFPTTPGELDDVVARTDAQMRLAQPATTMTGSGDRWVYNNATDPADPAGKWYLVLAPATGEYPYPVFFWEIDEVAEGSSIVDRQLDWSPTVTPTAAPAAATAGGPALTCAPTDPAVGATVTCEVTGGDPGIEILWRASAGDAVVGTAGVGLGDDGVGTFSFVLPDTAVGQRLLVELVAWTDPLDVGAVGRPLPTVVRAGEGTSGRPSVPASWPAALAVAALGVITWRPRRAASEPEAPRVTPIG